MFPNPTAGPATPSFFLAAGGAVRAEFVGVLGRPVRVLAAEQLQPAGPHTLPVPALAPGLYTVRFAHAGRVTYRKLVVE